LTTERAEKDERAERDERAGTDERATAPRRVLQGGRLKAYRPLPDRERARALEAGLAAYRRGDFFEAHELLEPAWMGTDDPAERDLYQGLIKLAAGFVHAVRGNPAGVVNNLHGARIRLAAAIAAGGPDAGIDLSQLVAAIDDRIETARSLPATTGTPLALEPPMLTRSSS
jgi:hypothetical protein